MSPPPATGPGAGEFLLSEATPPPRPWPPAAKAAAYFGSGCVLLVGMEFVVLVAALRQLALPNTSVQASISAPAHVLVGQKFPLVVTIKNPTSTAAPLSSVQAGAALLKQFRLENPRPVAATAPKSAPAGSTWTFTKSVPSRGSLKVTFDATAKAAGEHTESLDVQVGSGTQSVWFTVRAVESTKQ